jgi:ATP/maltotriose-dependent transcriptional regulator MalT
MGEVVGRDRELGAIEEFLEDAARGRAALVLEGEPGIGKTALWREALARAEKRGRTVLAARPAEAERELSFGALGDLLDGEALEAIRELPGPQRRALRTALLLDEPDGVPTDPRTIGVALLALIREVARARPLIVAIDDVQWLDRPTAAALTFAFRRLEAESAGFLGTARPRAAFAVEDLRHVTVGPLDLTALDEIVRRTLGTQLPRPLLRRLEQASGGNPFYALELARALVRRGGPRRASDELTVPDDLRELIRERLAALPVRTRRALAVAAALARPTAALVEAAVEDAGALEAAARAGVLESNSGSLRFTHPLLASVVYSDTPEPERRRLHRRLAELVADPEERAHHAGAAATGPDADVAAAMEEAGFVAARRGAPEAAAELLERARTLTPRADQDARRRRTLAHAGYRFVAGDGVGARAVLERQLAELGPGRARAETLLALVKIVWDDFDTLAELCGQAIEAAGSDDRLLADIHLIASDIEGVRGDLREAARHARSAVELAEGAGADDVLALALTQLAAEEFCRGNGVQRHLLERAVELERDLSGLPLVRAPTRQLGRQLLWADELDEARVLLVRQYARAVELGDVMATTDLALDLTDLETRAGNWDTAGRHAEQMHELALQSGVPQFVTMSHVARLTVFTVRGDVDRARRAAAEALAIAETAGDENFRVVAHNVLGVLELSLGDYAAAHAHSGDLAERERAMGYGDPGIFRIQENAIEALIGVGELERARDLTAELDRIGRKLDRPRLRACAGRCEGLLAAARGEIPTALAAFDRALEFHERLPDPFELGRTLLASGGVLRRARRREEARERLERALAIFERLGARLWAERAREELARFGGRPLRTGALTPTEQRIAELVAAGKSNHEVARALHVSPKTVEWNLSKVYRKLHVRSRTELAAKLR